MNKLLGPTPSDERNGNFLDRFGCCKVCDGEIPHGHMDNCDIWKLEQKRSGLETTSKDLHGALVRIVLEAAGCGPHCTVEFHRLALESVTRIATDVLKRHPEFKQSSSPEGDQSK